MENLDFSDEDFFLHLPKGDHERPLHLLRLSSKRDSDTDSYTSVPDTQGRRFIKRKVLRKHKGEPHVCDESFYIEDSAPSVSSTHHTLHTHLDTVRVATMYKMYNAQWDEGDDRNSLSSSFWSDEEKQQEEEEEELEIQPVVNEENFKPVAQAQGSLQKASVEENGSDDDDDEKEEEEEEVVIERGVEEEESKPVTEAESLQEASEEEKSELNNQENITGQSSENVSVGEDEEDEGEEDKENEVVRDESKPEDSPRETSDKEKPELNSQENFTGLSSENGSDDDGDDEDEDEGNEQVGKEEETKSSAEAKVSIQETSDEEKPELNNQENITGQSSEGGSDDDGDDEDDDEDEGNEQVGKEEETTPVAGTDSLLETLEEEKPEVNIQENFTGESSEDASVDDDGDDEDENEEDEENKGVVKQKETKPVAETDLLLETLEEEKPEVNVQENFTRESSRGGSEDDVEGSSTSSCSSPAPSLMTSGYGTYRPEEQEGGDYRDDHSITEFDQDSRRGVSEARDDEEEEEDRSPSSSGGFDINSTREPGDNKTRPEGALEEEDEPEPDVTPRPHEEVDVADTKPTDDLLKEDLRAETNETSEELQQQLQPLQPHVAGNQDGFLLDEKRLEDGRDPEEGRRHGKLDEEEQELTEDKDTEELAEDKVESEDPDESSSNVDVRFIDSKVDLSWKTDYKTYEEWEGNLRRQKDSASFTGKSSEDGNYDDGDGDDEEEDEDEEIEGVVKEKEAKPLEEAEDSLVEEEKPEVTDQENFTGQSCEDGSEEVEEEEQEEVEAIERVVKEEKTKFVSEAEDSLLEVSEEEKPEVTDEENFTGESSEDRIDEEEEDEEDEEEFEEEEDEEDEKEFEELEEEDEEVEEEDEEEFEEVEEDEAVERVVKEEETKSLPEAEDSNLEVSEERPEVTGKKSFTGDSSDDGSDDDEEEEEEEGTVDPMVKEESKLSAESEDSLQETSDEEQREINDQENFTGQSSEDGSDDDDDDDDDDEEEIEQVVKGEETKPVAETQDSLQEASGEENPEGNIQGSFTGESSRGGSDDDDEMEGNCTSSCSSPALSRMTSGYSTYRPEEQEGGDYRGGGDYRDDHTVTELDQDDEEEDRSPSSSGGFNINSTREPGDNKTHPEGAFEDEEEPEPDVTPRPHEEVDVADTKPTDDLLKEDLRAEINETEELQQQLQQLQQLQHLQQLQPHVAGNQDGFLLDEKRLEDGRDPEEGRRHEELCEEEQELTEVKDTEELAEDKVESEDPDESSSNVDVRLMESEVDVSWRTNDTMSEEWEGTLSQEKDSASCLEDGLSKLHLSTSTQPDLQADDDSCPSDGDSPAVERLSLSAFESYFRNMIDTQSDGDHRPKSKSFIRPVIGQHAIKKTDPVAKYFQYKHHWDRLKLPGERDRRALRCEIKERLAFQPPPPKPRRVFVPNTYVVPTEKKRPALCWKIRSDLANGIAPSKFNY